LNTTSLHNDNNNSIFDALEHIVNKEQLIKLIEIDTHLPNNNTCFTVVDFIEKKYVYISKNLESCIGINSIRMYKEGFKYIYSLIPVTELQLFMSILNDISISVMNPQDETLQKKDIRYSWNNQIQNNKGELLNMFLNATPLNFYGKNKPTYLLIRYTVINSNKPIDIYLSIQQINEQNKQETIFFKNYTLEQFLNTFSNREKEITRLLISKNTSKTIAKKLNISLNTVNTHRRNILKKFNISSTGELLKRFNCQFTDLKNH